MNTIKRLWQLRPRIITGRKFLQLKAAYLTEGFVHGLEAGRKLERMEWTGRGVVLPGFDAAAEAEQILEGKTK
jgi:hypothetical protein